MVQGLAAGLVKVGCRGPFPFQVDIHLGLAIKMPMESLGEVLTVEAQDIDRPAPNTFEAGNTAQGNLGESSARRLKKSG